MKTLFFSLPLFFIYILIVSCNQSKKEKTTDSLTLAKNDNKNRLHDSSYYRDASFAVAASEIHLMQVKAGRLCETNASLDTIRKFGRTFVENQTATHQQLQGWANIKKASLPESLTVVNQKKYDALSKMKDRDFDKKFTHEIISDQQTLLTYYRKEAESGQDSLLKAWAREKIVIMETDLETAYWIESVLSKAPLKNVN